VDKLMSEIPETGEEKKKKMGAPKKGGMPEFPKKGGIPELPDDLKNK